MKRLRMICRKISVCILFCFFCAGMLQAQSLSSTSKKAINLYSQARNTISPDDAIMFAQQAIDVDSTFTEAYWFLADRLRDAGRAEGEKNVLIAAAQKTTYRIDDTLYKLANVFYKNGEYESAIDAIERASEKLAPQKREKIISKSNAALKLKNNPVPYDPKPLSGVNTSYDDYWPSFSLNGKVVSTTVLVADKTRSNLEWNEEIFWCFQDSTGAWRQTQNIGYPTNTEENEGSQSFSSDGRYMFFVACDKPDTKGGCDIYYSVFDGKNWSLPYHPGEPLNTRYWETNPCLSADGRELFFASNRPGGKGKKDIWECVVTRLSDGSLSFSSPINLSDSINTTEDEFSPFIHPDGHTLYFATNGRDGLGGYDLFLSKRNENYEWSSPKNLGYPINTHKDEYGFVVDSKGEKAYFSSEVNPEQGKDIFEIELYAQARPDAMNYFSGVVRETESQRPLIANVEISDVNSAKKYVFSTNDFGVFSAYLPIDNEYAINVHKKDFIMYSQTILPQSLSEQRLFINLDSIVVGKSLILKNITFETDSYLLAAQSNPELQAIFDFMQNNPQISVEIIGHTDDIGSEQYNLELSQNRAEEVKRFLCKKGISDNRIKCVGKGESEPLASNDTEEGRALNRRTELKITK